MKPYQQVPIVECYEPLVAIPIATFAVETPHPYVKLAAPYGSKSPYYLRQGVLERLLIAQSILQHRHPDWRIQIFDAYRPITVQQFMVDYTFKQVFQEAGLNDAALTETERQAILEKVYQFWAVPSLNPATPPPHSTGAAVDLTLINAAGQAVDMGSPIDEMSPRSYPEHYATARAPQAQFAENRLLLKTILTSVGFEQHPQEWWHFSYGDQLWAWLAAQKLTDQKRVAQKPTARYGCAKD